MVTVNGTEYDVAGKSLQELVEMLDFAPAWIAVEKNMDIIPKSEYATTILADGDSLEVVSFVGGG